MPIAGWTAILDRGQTIESIAPRKEERAFNARDLVAGLRHRFHRHGSDRRTATARVRIQATEELLMVWSHQWTELPQSAAQA
jgi:hypothetical protein